MKWKNQFFKGCVSLGLILSMALIPLFSGTLLFAASEKKNLERSILCEKKLLIKLRSQTNFEAFQKKIYQRYQFLVLERYRTISWVLLCGKTKQVEEVLEASNIFIQKNPEVLSIEEDQSVGI